MHNININKNTHTIPRIPTFSQIIPNYQYYIFDCDGVIWNHDYIFEDTIKNIKSLITQNKTVFFLSNANAKTRYDLQDKLKKAGIEISINNIYTSSFLIAKYITDFHPNVKNIFLIGSEGLEKECEDKGLTIYGGISNKRIEEIENFNKDHLEDFEIDKSIDACICGFDHKFNYYKLTYACQVVNKTGLFFGTNIDHKVKIKDGMVPGSYAFISAIETCTEIKAKIVTKPDPRSYEIIMNHHNIEVDDEIRSRTLMIGDNLKTDILFANNNRIDSLLVLTGVTSEEEIEGGVSVPTYVLKTEC